MKTDIRQGQGNFCRNIEISQRLKYPSDARIAGNIHIENTNTDLDLLCSSRRCSGTFLILSEKMRVWLSRRSKF